MLSLSSPPPQPPPWGRPTIYHHPSRSHMLISYWSHAHFPWQKKKTGRLSQLDSMCWIWGLRRGHTLKKWPGSCSRVGPTQCSAWWWGRWFQNRVKPRSLIGTQKNIDTKQHSENTIQYSSTLLFWISPGYPLNHTRCQKGDAIKTQEHTVHAHTYAFFSEHITHTGGHMNIYIYIWWVYF